METSPPGGSLCKLLKTGERKSEIGWERVEDVRKIVESGELSSPEPVIGSGEFLPRNEGELCETKIPE
jgi:hypothetical protein